MKTTRFSKMGFVAAIAVFAALMAGCATHGQSGALAGGGIGALAGQAIGRNTEATLIGTAVGTGIGYIIGNEADKQKAYNMSYMPPPPPPPRPPSYSTSGYSHREVGPLANTRWHVISVAPSGYYPPYTSKVIEFGPSGQVTTTTTFSDGTLDVDTERYRVVGKTLIINKPGYLINAEFGIEGDQLILDAEDFRAVMRRIPM